jgi:DNA (cytosine-5)-methyltransferase 1
MLHTAKVIPLKAHRGAPRFWTEGNAPLKSGFTPGAKFIVTRHGAGVLLKLDDSGNRKVSKKAYASGKEMPVIDINSAEVLEPIQGCEVVQVLFGPGQVSIQPLASEVRRQRRLARAKERLTSDEPLTTAGIAAGGGVLSHAVHAGLADAGAKAKLAVHNEIREELSDQATRHNDIVSAHTQMLSMPLQELAFDVDVLREVGEVDIVELGLPCSGASVAGRAKRKLAMPEEHPDVGHLVVGALALLARLNPVACVFENVVPYAKSASAQLIRQQLRDLGYDTHERELFGPDFGALEGRKRWCMVAVTKGIDFDLDSLWPEPFSLKTVADAMEPPEAVADRWSTMPGLKAKQVRDRAAGKGFMMQVYDGTEKRIAVLTKGIAKNRSTDPKFRHPTNSNLLRIPTAREHARCKGVPEHLIEGLSQTTAHELLGQGIVYEPFRQVARHLGRALKHWAAQGSITTFGTAFRAAA